MLQFLSFFTKKKETSPEKKGKASSTKPGKTSQQIATRKGELGEYKIDIQLDQLPKEYRFLSDILVANSKAKSGYSQIDHVVITPWGIFVIETKNYQGTIYGGKDRKTWLINGKFKMMSPFVQNYGHIQSLKSLLDSTHHDHFISMVSFTKRATFKVGLEYRKIASNELIVYDIELSEFIHRKISVMKTIHKEPLLDQDTIIKIYNSFANANITDPKLRAMHEQALKATNENGTPVQQSTCVVCNKPVSDKVKNYCLTNKKFNSKIYCFDHQKNVK